MSVLRDRIVRQGAGADYHPYGTGETPMIMPLHEVRYEADSAVYYEQLHPLIAADGAIIPSQSGAAHPETVPAGQP